MEGPLLPSIFPPPTQTYPCRFQILYLIPLDISSGTMLTPPSQRLWQPACPLSSVPTTWTLGIYEAPLPSQGLKPKWTGPFQVILTTPTVTKLKGHSSWVHFSSLKKAPLFQCTPTRPTSLKITKLSPMAEETKDTAKQSHESLSITLPVS